MPGILPPTLPTGGSHLGARNIGSRPIGRAQNMSVSRLNQHKERQAASTSIGRAMNKNSRSGPSTSVFHAAGSVHQATGSIFHPAGTSAKASTSIFHPNKQQDGNAGIMSDEQRDDARHDYMRKGMMEKRRKERAAHKHKVNEKLSGDAKESSRKYMHGMSETYAKKHGLHVDDKMKVQMKHDIDRAAQRGSVNRSDIDTMKGLVDGM